MTRADPQSPPYALTVASSDSGGGAGIQADLKTMTRLGVAAGSVVVATTAQNTAGVRDTHVHDPALIRAQFDAVADDYRLDAVKVGMLATADAVRTVADRLATVDAPVVVDPVMVATSGDRLLAPDAVDAYDEAFAAATLVTPNADEAAALAGERPVDAAARRRVADWFLDRGADAVLLKGGHLDGGVDADADAEGGGGGGDRGDDAGADVVRDHLVTADDQRAVSHPRVAPSLAHGSGCTLSSAIAARLAHGDPLPTAVERGVAFVHAAIAAPLALGAEGSVNHLVDGDWTFAGAGEDGARDRDRDRDRDRGADVDAGPPGDEA